MSFKPTGIAAENVAPVEPSVQSVGASSSAPANDQVDEGRHVEPTAGPSGAELDDFAASLDVRVNLSTLSSCCSTVKVNVKPEDDPAAAQPQPQSSQPVASPSVPEITVEEPQTPALTSEQAAEEMEMNGRVSCLESVRASAGTFYGINWSPSPL